MMLNKIRKKLSYTSISPLFYTEQLSQAYLTPSVAGGTLKGKTAFITGATGGIGAAVCMRMAAEGCKLIISGRNEKKLIEIKESICRRYPSVDIKCEVMDQKDNDSIVLCVDKLIKLGIPEIIVNCAGTLYESDRRGEFRALSSAIFDDSWKTNFKGLQLFCDLVALKMNEEGISGTIINISSICSLFNGICYTPYGLSKTAINQYSCVLREKYPNLNVHAVLPGSVATKMNSSTVGDNISKECNILNRMLLPEEIAALVAFLAGDIGKKVSNSFITASACEVL